MKTNLYGCLCKTETGGCFVVVPAEAKEAAHQILVEMFPRNHEVVSVDKIDPAKGPCVFWANELEG